MIKLQDAQAVQVIVAHQGLADEVNAVAARAGGEFVRVPGIEGENDLPVYMFFPHTLIEEIKKAGDE